MRARYFAFVILLLGTTALFGQAVPTAIGPGGISVSGSLQVAFRYSYAAVLDPDYPDYQTTIASAAVDYGNSNERRPFRMNYIGGYSSMLSGPPQVTGLFQRLFLSQGFVGKKWNAIIGNETGYLPGAPTTGFSGIPGVGEPIGVTNPLPSTSQSILTVNTHTVDNVSQGSVERRLNHALTIQGNAAWELLRYPDGDGFDTNSAIAGATLQDRLSARTFLSSAYRFSRFTYSGRDFVLSTHTLFAGLKRVWTARLSSDFSAGPEWVGSNDAIFPSSLGLAGNAGLDYSFRFLTAGVNYTRGINGGSGYLPGAKADSVNGWVSRQFGRDLTVGVTGSWMRTTPLNEGSPIDATYGGVEATRRMGRALSIFANYTTIRQTSNQPLPDNVVKGVMHIFSAGVEYSPRVQHLHQ